MPHSIDTSVPNAARMYDYWLDGSHDFAADRALADKLEQAVPAGRDGTRVNGYRPCQHCRPVALEMAS